MAPSSIPLSTVLGAPDALAAPVRIGRSVLPWFQHRVAMILFWAAIALPVCYLALLVDGVGGAGELRLFFELFGLHVVALAGGRYHR